MLVKILFHIVYFVINRVIFIIKNRIFAGII